MRILVTADSAIARRQLQAMIEESGHTVLDSTELGAGALLAAATWDVDAVVAGLFAARPSPQQRSAVLVEIGIALGRETPVLLLTREGVQASALTGLPRIEATLDDPETLSLKLDLLLQGVRGGSPRHPEKGFVNLSKQRPARTDFREAGYELERTVAEVLASSGSALFTTTKPNSPIGRHDIAFYLEGHETELGLVLVEVKRLAGGHGQKKLREASRQLARYVAQTNAGLGLVIHDGEKLSSQRRTFEPLVVAISLDQLRDELVHRPLEDVVRRLRNVAIHGL